MTQDAWADLPPGFRFSIEDEPAAEELEAINDALVEFNRPYLRDPAFGRIGLFVRGETGALMAGLDANFYAGWLFVNNLWVHAEHRRRGIGRRLLREAEHLAVSSGCHSAWLDTWSFQGPAFYRRLGYEVFGSLDYPPDHQRLFLKKCLSPGVP
jgi:ribosomal protein S18 acetylase RimI-like enzyme